MAGPACCPHDRQDREVQNGLTAKGEDRQGRARKNGTGGCADETLDALIGKSNVTDINFDDVISDPVAGSSLTIPITLISLWLVVAGQPPSP